MKKQDAGYRMQDAETNNKAPHQILHPVSHIPYPDSSIPYPALMQRVRWRCRRGLLELDILLGRFIDAHYAKLSEAEVQTFEELLDMPDNPLWDMISCKQDSTHDKQSALLEKIRSV